MEIRRQWDDGEMQDYVAETTTNKDPALRVWPEKRVILGALERRSRGVKELPGRDRNDE